MIWRAWADGWKRVLTAPVIAGGVFLLTLVVAAPLAVSVRNAIGGYLGDSLAAGAMAEGFDYTWFEEYLAQATGVGRTFVPTVIGFAATLDNLSGLLDGTRPAPALWWALALYLAGWAFLTGGVLDRYARQRPIRTHAFFAACGVFFIRFLRLAVVAALVYWWLFRFVHPYLFEDWYQDVTRELSVERVAFYWRLGFYVVFGVLLVAVNVVVDYAKVRLVVEDRHSVLGALVAAMRFVARHPVQAAGLYALNGLIFLALLAAWSWLAPGTGGTGNAIWLAFAAGQAYILARLALKLHFLASQTALFQANLAHARYAAAPRPVWPESPTAETIVRSSG